MSNKDVIKTTTVSTVRSELQIDDLKAAETALKAYNGAISAAKAHLIYKKLTGKPGQIDFFEEEN
jgi:hypothetical protein